MNMYHVEKDKDQHLILHSNGLIMLAIFDERDAQYLCQLFNRGTLILNPQKEASGAS